MSDSKCTNKYNVQKGKQTRERIFNFIIEYISLHGYSPSIREIAIGCGLKGASSVHNHLNLMLKLGVIETDNKGAARAIRVPGYKFTKIN